MIFGRIRQFARAVAASVTDDDMRFVCDYLPDDLRPLFFAMSVPDQHHAIMTARTALSLARASDSGVDERLLARVALLHDVGRRAGDMGAGGIVGKVATVLIASVAPSWARKRAEGDGSAMTHWLHIYYHHAAIGAHLIRDAGYEREAAIVARHHELSRDDDEPELKILRMADNLN